MKILQVALIEFFHKIWQFLISQCMAAIVFPFVFIIYVFHHLIVRSCVTLYLLIRFRGLMKLVDSGGDAMFGFKSEGNTRNILIALECQPLLAVKKDRKQLILDIVNKKVGNRRPYERLCWIFTKHAGYFCWKYDTDFNVDNHVINLPPETSVNRDGLLELIKKYSEDMTEDHPQWQFIIIPRYINEKGLESEAIILRFHHGILDGLSFATFMSHALGSVAPESDDQPMPEPCPETFPYNLDPINYRVPLKYRILFNINCFLFGFYQLLKTVTSTDHHWKLRCEYPEEKNFDYSELIDAKAVSVIRHSCGVSVPSVLSYSFLQALEAVVGDRVPDHVKIGQSLAILPYPNELFHNRFSMMTVPFKRKTQHALGKLKQLQIYHQAGLQALQGPEYFLYYWFFQFYGKLPAALLKYTLKKARFSFFVTHLPFTWKQVAALNYRVTDVVGWPPYTTDAGIGFTSVGYCGKIRLGVTADSSWLTKEELRKVTRETVREVKMLAHECSYSTV